MACKHSPHKKKTTFKTYVFVKETCAEPEDPPNWFFNYCQPRSPKTKDGQVKEWWGSVSFVCIVAFFFKLLGFTSANPGAPKPKMDKFIHGGGVGSFCLFHCDPFLIMGLILDLIIGSF